MICRIAYIFIYILFISNFITHNIKKNESRYRKMNDYKNYKRFLYMKEYLNNIRNIYKEFDTGHDERHYDEVVIFGLNTAKRLNDPTIDMSILITVLAFHDIGRIVGDQNHEVYSATILARNHTVQSLFSSEEIELMQKIVKEHRSRNTATTIYSKILKDADKIPSSYLMRRLYRIVGYNYDHYRNEGNESIIKHSIERLQRSKQTYDVQCEVNNGLYQKLDLSLVTPELIRDVLYGIINDKTMCDFSLSEEL